LKKQLKKINQTTSKIFLDSPKQLLGQKLSIIINPSKSENVNLFKTLKLMKYGQLALIFETSFIGDKFNDSEVILSANLFGISSNMRFVELFALILKDKIDKIA
jgi:hypothetical protein